MELPLFYSNVHKASTLLLNLVPVVSCHPVGTHTVLPSATEIEQVWYVTLTAAITARDQRCVPISGMLLLTLQRCQKTEFVPDKQYMYSITSITSLQAGLAKSYSADLGESVT